MEATLISPTPLGDASFLVPVGVQDFPVCEGGTLLARELISGIVREGGVRSRRL